MMKTFLMSILFCFLSTLALAESLPENVVSPKDSPETSPPPASTDSFDTSLQKAKLILRFCGEDQDKMKNAMTFLKEEIAYQLHITIPKGDNWIPEAINNTKLTFAKENIDHSYQTVDRYCQGKQYIALLIRDATEKKTINDQTIISTLYENLKEAITSWKTDYRELLSVVNETITQYKANNKS